MSNTKVKPSTMTEGSILKALLLFAFPILIGNIFQQFYNIADTAIIGNLLGDDALASVGAAAPVYNLIVSIANGMTNGFAVIIARYFGAGDKQNMKKAITLSYILTIGISVILTVISLIGLNPLLVFLKTPDNIIADTENYLRIIFMFSTATMLYNMFAGMFRAIGNSRIPLYFLIVSTAVNIVLDIVFVKYMDMGVSGAGYATVIAQVVSVIFCFVCVKCKYKDLGFDRKSAVFDKSLLSDLSLTGLSMGLMLAVVSVGSVALQNAVNSLGSDTITAHTAARKFDDIFMLPLGTVSLSASTFASQNYGAKNYERVKKGIVISIIIALIWSAVSVVCSFTIVSPLVKAFTGTENDFIIETAVKYIKINIPFFFVLSFLLVLRSSLQGVGRKIVPLCGSIIELIAKFSAVIFIAPVGYIGICWLEPVIWIICAVIIIIDFIRFIHNINKEVSND
ncbi:MAG: MATE family efflux transporter [Ruminococcus flavefaciens]|nr:MATE family efflux transporter [Ruminococcus flavefaciens]